MEPATLSTKEIIEAFARYAKEMKEGSSSSKLNISGEMLCLLSNYLVQQEETVNTTGILLLLEELANNGEIVLVDHIEEIPEIINKLNYDKEYRDKVIRSGYKAADKLGGELDVFERRFPEGIKKILNNTYGKL